MIDALRPYLDLAGFQARHRWLVVFVLAVLVSGVEATAALLVYVLLGLVTGVDDALNLPLLGDLQALVPGVDRSTMLLGAAAFVAAFFVIRGLLVIAQEYVTSRVTENAGARLSARLADGYLALPHSFHLQRNSAELIRNAYTTVEVLAREVFRPAVKIVSEGLIVLGIVAVLLLTAPLATVLVLALMLPTAAVLLRLVFPRLRELGVDKQSVARASLRSLQQSLEGLRDIRVLGRQRFFGREFRRTRERLARVHYLRDVYREVPGVGLETMIVVVIAVLFAGAVVLEGEAVSAVPILGLFGYAAIRLKPSMTEVVKGINSIRFARAGVDDLRADLDLIERVGVAEVADVEPLPFEHEVNLDHVTYRYPGAEVDALREVDLRIGKGESIGIIGTTGGGKTTLVDVLVGLLEPTEGAVRVDGVDIRHHVQAWQLNLGVVPQSIFVVDDTLRRNIALGIPDDEISERRLEQAIELAQLRSVVDELPDGLETIVGERGTRLSGGQRQRVAIARAVYRQPDVLIFDEGTSALDMGTEGQLLQALEALRARHTIVTVAHRLATVRDCDRVVIIEGGRIIDVAPFDELVERHEGLSRMAT